MGTASPQGAARSYVGTCRHVPLPAAAIARSMSSRACASVSKVNTFDPAFRTALAQLDPPHGLAAQVDIAPSQAAPVTVPPVVDRLHHTTLSNKCSMPLVRGCSAGRCGLPV
jgi:hypothetical protein